MAADFASLELDRDLDAVVITAGDGRQATIGRAAIVAWLDARQGATRAELEQMAGETLTARWNAHAGLRPLAFHVRALSLRPPRVAVLVAAPGYVPPARWWLPPGERQV